VQIYRLIRARIEGENRKRNLDAQMYRPRVTSRMPSSRVAPVSIRWKYNNPRWSSPSSRISPHDVLSLRPSLFIAGQILSSPTNFRPDSGNHGPIGDRLHLDAEFGTRQTEGMNDGGCRRFLHQSGSIFLIELQFHLAIGR
jgi:hypothetical protein